MKQFKLGKNKKVNFIRIPKNASTSLYNFFGDASPSPGLADFLELENDSYLLQENGSRLILEQGI